MRAIILAAGRGTRLMPLTEHTPKSLIKIKGIPLIERQINYLKERNIEDIIIVVGYLSHKFDYLKSTYNVKILYNDKFEVFNNIYSMYLVKEYLPDSYVIDADIYLNRNFIDENICRSSYFSGEKFNFDNEWILRFNDKNKVIDIVIGDGSGYILSGVSYWSKKDGEFLMRKLKEVIENKRFNNLYWDNIVLENINKLDLYFREIDSNDCFEIDNIKDLNKLKEKLENEF